MTQTTIEYTDAQERRRKAAASPRTQTKPSASSES